MKEQVYRAGVVGQRERGNFFRHLCFGLGNADMTFPEDEQTKPSIPKLDHQPWPALMFKYADENEANGPFAWGKWTYLVSKMKDFICRFPNLNPPHLKKPSRN